jgi:uncharacterized RDD family membrane protein YckC
MTEPPQYPSYPGDQPPPPGYYPPPPPGYQPPPGYGTGYPQPAYGQAFPGGPAYASWGARVGAYLLDGLFGFLVVLPFAIAGGIVLGITGESTTDVYGNSTITGESPVGWVLIVLAYVLAFAFSLWNYVFRQGKTGQTLGKKIVGISVVRESTGQATGAGLALGRVVLISVLSVVTCYLNLLWPLWDDKKQALHDKVASTVVIRSS